MSTSRTTAVVATDLRLLKGIKSSEDVMKDGVGVLKRASRKTVIDRRILLTKKVGIINPHKRERDHWRLMMENYNEEKGFRSTCLFVIFHKSTRY